MGQWTRSVPLAAAPGRTPAQPGRASLTLVVGEPPLVALNEARQGGPEDGAEHPQLDQIQPALAGLVVRYERLRTVHGFGDVDLA